MPIAAQWGSNMNYGCSREEIKCNGDEVSVEYVWSNVDGLSGEWGVQKRTGVTRVSWSSRAVLRWFGHIERMEEYWLVKKTMGSDVRGVKLRGRSYN